MTIPLRYPAATDALLVPFGMVELHRRRFTPTRDTYGESRERIEPVFIDAQAVTLVEAQYGDQGQQIGTLVQVDAKTNLYVTDPLPAVLAAVAQARRDVLDV